MQLLLMTNWVELLYRYLAYSALASIHMNLKLSCLVGRNSKDSEDFSNEMGALDTNEVLLLPCVFI